MNTNTFRPDTPTKRYMAVASVLLLLFTIVIPPLGVSFVALHVLFLAAWLFLQKVKPGKRFWRTIVWGVLLSNVFLLVYLQFQAFIPFWDYAGYYIETLRSGTLMQTDLPQFFRQVYESMLTQDYTLLPTVFIAPFLNLLGGSFTAYVLLIYNLFIVPFLIVFGLLVYEISPKCTPLIFLFTPFLSPVLRGYLDGAGLFYVAIWLYVIYKQTLRKSAIKEAILLGILSVLLIFTRRWYLFFVVGTYAALVLSGVVRRAYDPKYDLKTLLQNLAISGGVTLGIVVLFFFPYLKRLLGNTMQDAYSAYMFGDFWWNIKYFIRYYGFLPMAFCALGLFGLRRRWYRQFTLFLLFQIPVMFFLFTRIQTVSYHHQYLFAPSIFLLMVIGVSALPKCKKAAPIALCVALAMAFTYIYVPTSTNCLRNVFSSVRFAPKTMETEGVLELRDTLNQLSEAEGENGYVYILASSEILNDDMLKNSRLPMQENAIPALLGTNHVDRRDGMPNHLLVSKFIVVADPVQVHLGTENQQVVDFFAREILDGTYTQNLERIHSIKITDEVTAHIYRRNAGYSEAFLRRAQEHFNMLYPEHGEMFSVDFIWSQNS